MDDVEVKQQIGQRRGQEGDARQSELVVEHGAEVAQTLLNRQATTKERVIQTENLRHPTRPSGTLNHV
ncbi:hypothetical protein D3C76_1742820 [compost metagenome]